MTARRIPTPDPSSIPPRRRVRATFDGRPIEGIEGEPLAVSLLADDRVVLSRSFRFHRPRGLMCSTGQCGWCECSVDGRPSVRSCRVPMREGLVAHGEHAWPTVERDLFGWLDLGSRFVPPTFYHHQFLRPMRLRQRYLDVLRGFGGRGRLETAGDGGPAPAAQGRASRDLEVDVLVVGGGRSGLAAATDAARSGARVALIEAAPDVVELADVTTLAGTVAVGWYDGTVAAIGPDAHWSIRATSVIAATGSYERVPAVRGADRPGVMGARLALELIERHRVLPGERPLLVGEPRALEAVRAAFVGAGVEPAGPVAEGDLRRVLGRRRVTGALVADGPIEQRRDPGGSRRVLEPDPEPRPGDRGRSRADVERRGPRARPRRGGRTTVPGLSVVGSAAGGASPSPSPAPEPAADRALACFCEDVHHGEIRAQCAAGYADPELVKRRTGALTGPCQGKYCLQAFATTMAECGQFEHGLPTGRPPLQPTRLGDLVPAPTDGPSDGPS